MFRFFKEKKLLKKSLKDYIEEIISFYYPTKQDLKKRKYLTDSILDEVKRNRLYDESFLTAMFQSYEDYQENFSDEVDENVKHSILFGYMFESRHDCNDFYKRFFEESSIKEYSLKNSVLSLIKNCPRIYYSSSFDRNLLSDIFYSGCVLNSEKIKEKISSMSRKDCNNLQDLFLFKSSPFSNTYFQLKYEEKLKSLCFSLHFRGSVLKSLI